MQTDSVDIPEIAHAMIAQYGNHAVALMETRAGNCRRQGELARAAFWHLVADTLKEIEASTEINLSMG